MKLKSLLQAALWLSSLLIAHALAGQLLFAPSPGSTLEKTFTQDWHIQLDDYLFVINGENWGETQFAGIDLDTEVSQLLVVNDTYQAVHKGQPEELHREFQTIREDLEVTSSWGRLGGRVESFLGTSPLEGRRIVFRQRTGAAPISFGDPSQSDQLKDLDGLCEDMDQRCLLPGHPVEVGDSWELDLTNLADLLSPGGYLAWILEDKRTGQQVPNALDGVLMGDLRARIGTQLEGRATATYVSLMNGLAQIDLHIEVEGLLEKRHLEDLASYITGDGDEWSLPEPDLLKIELKLTAKGSALWDTRRDHINSLELEGQMNSTFQLEMCLDFHGPLQVKLMTQFSAEFEQTLTTEG